MSYASKNAKRRARTAANVRVDNSVTPRLLKVLLLAPVAVLLALIALPFSLTLDVGYFIVRVIKIIWGNIRG